MNRDPISCSLFLAVCRRGLLAATLALGAASACARHELKHEPLPVRQPLAAKLSTVAAVASGPNASVRGLLFADVAEHTLPAVVSVASTRAARQETSGLPDDPFFRRFFGPSDDSNGPMVPGLGGGAPHEEHGLGSGVLLANGLIITNAHVVEGAKEILVKVGGRRRLEVKLVGSDPLSDLALLKITSDTRGLHPLDFADSSRVRLGEIVLAVGNPFGVGETVTMGIVSAKERADLGINDYEDFIQTDAAINPGNSGGALVDLEGNLVGIPSAILSRSGGSMGVGFAIPSNLARPVVTSLLEHGRVSRGYLGVSIQPIAEDLAQSLDLPSTDGILIADVKAQGPAAKAGLRRGDVVLSLQGQRVQSLGQFRNTIAAAGAGATIELMILRDKKPETVRVKLEELPVRKP